MGILNYLSAGQSQPGLGARRRMLDMAAGLTLLSRPCRAVEGGAVVDIPDWNRNYVSEGGGSILGAAAVAKGQGGDR